MTVQLVLRFAHEWGKSCYRITKLAGELWIFPGFWNNAGNGLGSILNGKRATLHATMQSSIVGRLAHDLGLFRCHSSPVIPSGKIKPGQLELPRFGMVAIADVIGCYGLQSPFATNTA